jgi:peptidoglycan/xylan/chitin deacetylase (PgdA/CDA1 family)
LRIPGLRKTKAAARWIRSRFIGGALILGYHRIAEAESDPFGLCVSPDHFSEHLRVLRNLARPIGLEELVRGLNERSIPKRSVVLTIDDGYADVFYQAWPLLQQYEIPLTLFVATGFSGRTFWWDGLAQMILDTPEVPPSLNLAANGFQFEWQATVSRANAPDSVERLGLLHNLQRYLAPLPPAGRDEMLDQLAQIIGHRNSTEPLARGMEPDELAQLAATDLVTIGAHSVGHPALGKLSVAEQESEIHQCRAWLEEIMVRPVTAFSYPHGSYTPTTQTIVQEAGFTCACASHNDVAHSSSDLFALPRFWVPDVDGETFGRWVRTWLVG